MFMRGNRTALRTFLENVQKRHQQKCRSRRNKKQVMQHVLASANTVKVHKKIRHPRLMAKVARKGIKGMYNIYFLDGIREGERDEIAELTTPLLEIKDDNAQVYNLFDDPRQELPEYAYSIRQPGPHTWDAK